MNAKNTFSSVSVLRMLCRACFMIALLFVGCTKKSALTGDDISPDKDARVAKSKKYLVTWSYLRVMAANGKNPSIYNFLKSHNQLVPKTVSGARTSEDCDSWDNECEEDQFDDGRNAAWRVDVPITVDGQTMYISIVVIYDTQTGEPVEQGISMYGNNTPNNSSYVPANSSYDGNTNQLNFIGNLSYNYSTTGTRQVGAEVTGMGTIDGTGLEVSLNGNSSTQSTITNSGIIYVNFSVNLSNSTGGGMVQLNGVNGPAFSYYLAPH